MKRMLWLFTFMMFTLVFWAGTAQAKPAQVQATQEGTASNAVVNLKWKFVAGDKVYRTFDGDNWTELTVPAVSGDGMVTVLDNNDGNGFPRGSNVFYEFRDDGYAASLVANDPVTNKVQTRASAGVQAHIKRVNMFIDSGNPTIENAHGNYVSNTNACASCHVNHKGKSAAKQLLKQDSVRALCETCHTAGQAGSKYLVDYGAVRDKDGLLNPSPAGPISTGNEAEKFGAAVPDDTILNERGVKKATSAHPFTGDHKAQGDSLNVKLSTDKKTLTTLETRNMQCTSCHQAHPNDNNYRLLKTVNPSTYTLDAATSTYTATTNKVVFEAYAVNKDGNAETVRYKSGSVQFCEQCHKVFHNGTSTTFNGETFFLHPSEKAMNLHGVLLTSDLPLQNAVNLAVGDSPNNITLENGKTKSSYITCITCHYSHGTSKTGEQASNFIAGEKSTMLKRMDNAGVCQECHKK